MRASMGKPAMFTPTARYPAKFKEQYKRKAARTRVPAAFYFIDVANYNKFFTFATTISGVMLFIQGKLPFLHGLLP